MSENDIWIERGKNYMEKFNKKSVIQKLRFLSQEEAIVGALKKIGREVEIKGITDIGCGFGRITTILCEMFPYADIRGLDLSEDQLRHARMKLPRVLFFKRDIVKNVPPTLTGRSQLVTCVEVLMHIDPENIESVVENLTIGRSEFILTVDWDTLDREDIKLADLAGFCWLHNYGKLFSDRGYYLMKKRKIPFVKQNLSMWRLRK